LQPPDPFFKARARFTEAVTVRGDTASANIAKPLATTVLRFASTFESRLAVVARAASVALSGRQLTNDATRWRSKRRSMGRHERKYPRVKRHFLSRGSPNPMIASRKRSRCGRASITCRTTTRCISLTHVSSTRIATGALARSQPLKVWRHFGDGGRGRRKDQSLEQLNWR
jgi:hypothetical protein